LLILPARCLQLAFDIYSAGAELYRSEHRSAELQIQSTNLTDQLNVINFASVFSGTAVAPSRSIAARLRFAF
jgi:hypothetical protein